MFFKQIILLFLVLLTPNSAQITWNNPLISAGTICSPIITATGVTITCSGKGYFVFDPLVMGYTTTMDLTITNLDIGQTLGIGLGQQTDSNCQSSNFPSLGETWASCTSSSGVCNKQACLFDKVTAYSSSSFSNLNLPDAMQTNKQYTWSFIPPTCPVTGKAWKIQVSSRLSSLFETNLIPTQ